MTVHHSSTDSFHCSITPHTPFATLPHLAFENVTKKSRPQLASGALLYAKVAAASKHQDPELVCYNPATGKSEGMGELKGGMLFDVGLGLARRLLIAKQREEGGLIVLEECASRIAFEIAVGRNGKVWIKAATVKEIMLIGRAIQETDQKKMGVEEQKKLVKQLLKHF